MHRGPGAMRGRALAARRRAALAAGSDRCARALLRRAFAKRYRRVRARAGLRVGRGRLRRARTPPARRRAARRARGRRAPQHHGSHRERVGSAYGGVKSRRSILRPVARSSREARADPGRRARRRPAPAPARTAGAQADLPWRGASSRAVEAMGSAVPGTMGPLPRLQILPWRTVAPRRAKRPRRAIRW